MQCETAAKRKTAKTADGTTERTADTCGATRKKGEQAAPPTSSERWRRYGS